jgi:hypothetical protein
MSYERFAIVWMVNGVPNTDPRPWDGTDHFVNIEEGSQNRSIEVDPNTFAFLAHVDPPPDAGPDSPGLIHYIGPRLFPLGVYMPKGYDIEARPGDDPTWTVLRARCLATGQVMCQWALQHEEVDGEMVADAVDLLEP